MQTQEQIIDFLNRELESRAYFTGFKPDELYEPINYVLANGGKRIRPLLLLASYNLFKDNLSEAIDAALAIEVFHNFTLLHDDIMDKSPMRRNKPTVHMKWNENIAILSGDAMLIKAYHLLANIDQRKLKDVLDEFNKVALEVCEGQQYDMNFETIPQITEAEYIGMIRLKTAVLFASCMKIGAILAEAHPPQIESLYQVGLNFGISFQLQDDLLDAFGDENQLGKRIGNDIVSNKKTFLMIKSLELANNIQNEEINRLMSGYLSDEEKISGMLAIYEELNIKEITEQNILSYNNQIFEAIAKLKVDEKRKSTLLDIANKLLKRKK